MDRIARKLQGLDYQTGVVVLQRQGQVIAMGMVWSAKRDIRRAMGDVGADDFYLLITDTPEWKLERMRGVWPGVKVWGEARREVRARGVVALAKLRRARGG